MMVVVVVVTCVCVCKEGKKIRTCVGAVTNEAGRGHLIGVMRVCVSKKTYLC
jgi:hypothetical protein